MSPGLNLEQNRENGATLPPKVASHDNLPHSERRFLLIQSTNTAKHTFAATLQQSILQISQI